VRDTVGQIVEDLIGLGDEVSDLLARRELGAGEARELDRVEFRG
jgi:hypothetical protein